MAEEGGGGRLYKARGADGEVAWVDHEELWRLQQAQADEARRQQLRRRRQLLLGLLGLVVVALVLVFLRLGDPGRLVPCGDGRGARASGPGRDGALAGGRG